VSALICRNTCWKIIIHVNLAINNTECWEIWHSFYCWSLIRLVCDPAEQIIDGYWSKRCPEAFLTSGDGLQQPRVPNPQRRAMTLQSSFWILCLITWLNWKSVIWESFLLQSFSYCTRCSKKILHTSAERSTGQISSI